MAMDHNLYSQDSEENIELKKVSEAFIYSQLSRKRPSLVHDKVEICHLREVVACKKWSLCES